MVSGFALGGFAQAFQKGQEQQSLDNYRTQELKLRQQGQENAEQREQHVRIDGIINDSMKTISESVNTMRTAKPDLGTDQLAKHFMPWVQMTADLAERSGRPGGKAAILAQFSTTLAKPTPFDVMGGGAAAPSRAAGGGARGAVMPPPVGQENSMYEARPANPANPDAPAPGARGAAAPAPAVDDVDRLTRAMAIADDPGLRQAFAIRLQDAMRQRGDDTEVKFLKDESGGEHPVFVSARRRSVTDMNGNPYVAPTGDDSDAHRIATAIKEGRQPPVTAGLYRNAKAVRADLERQGVNLTEMQLEWDSAKKQIASLNGPQMVRYAGLAKSVDRTIDEVRDLSKQMDLSGVPLANRAKIAAYIQTAGNTEGGQLAARYIAAVNTLKEEFTNLAQGGYAPTEAAWTLANQQVNADYGVKQLDASLSEVQRLIRYRLQGIPNFQTLGPGGANRYVPGGGGSPAGEAPQSGQSGTVGPVQWELKK